MKKGAYRYYFHIFGIGIKIARINLNNDNVIAAFLASIIMNILEYKRYKHYKINLAKVYFSCGLFNIVKHYEQATSDMIPIPFLFHHLVEDDKIENYGINDNGKKYRLVALDYGDFNVDRFNKNNVRFIDYR